MALSGSGVVAVGAALMALYGAQKRKSPARGSLRARLRPRKSAIAWVSTGGARHSEWIKSYRRNLKRGFVLAV